MTIIANLQRHAGSQSRSRSGDVTFTDYYIVRDDAGTAIDSIDIFAANVLPSYNTRVQNTNAYLTDIDVKCDRKDPSVWYATCVYRTREVAAAAAGDEDPVSFNAFVDYDTISITEVMDRAYDTGDAQGEPSLAVLNPVQDPFDPPLTRERQLDVVIIEQNYSTFNPSDSQAFRNTINDGALTVGGFPIADGAGLMRLVKPRNQFTADGTLYVRVRYEIVINDEGWNAQPLAQGFQFYTDVGNKYKRHIRVSDFNSDVDEGTTDDTWVTEPQRLAADGSLLTPGQSPVFMDFQRYFKRAWRSLNLPSRQDGSA